jgi:mRNA-degrading endonuclease RelE of RelBE toxin-antitoxin system
VKLTFIWTDAARRDLRRIDRDQALRILKSLARFGESGEGDVKELQGVLSGTHRLRVGDWRVRFKRLPGDVIEVLAVGNRGQAY